jgi:hypothetical protein
LESFVILSDYMQPIKIFIVLLVSGFLAWGVIQTAAASQSFSPEKTAPEPVEFNPRKPPAAHGVTLQESSDSSLSLELITPEFWIEGKISHDQHCQVLRVENYAESSNPLEPPLPQTGVLVGIPLEGEPTLNVIKGELVKLDGHYNLCPLELPIVKIDLNGKPEFLDQQSSPINQLRSNLFLPSEPVKLLKSGFIRNQRVAQLSFQPFRYNPITGQLQYYRRLQVRLNFPKSNTEFSILDTRNQAEPFETLLHNNLLNYEQARAWRQPFSRPSFRLNPTAPFSGPSIKLLVNQDGLFQVTGQDLLDAGVSLDQINPDNIHIYNQGSELAIEVKSQQENTFTATDSILFYGLQAHTLYTNENVYWLTWDGSSGRRIQTVDGSPGGSPIPEHFYKIDRIEENHVYQPSRPSGTENDHWYWNYTYASSSPDWLTYTLQLNDLSVSYPLSATLRGLFKGYSATPRHHTQIFLNNHLVDDAYWASEVEYSFEAQVPQSFLLEGPNTITVKCPLDGGISEDVVLINWFEIGYHRTYRARNDSLVLSIDQPGAWDVSLDGFTGDQLDLWEITSPLTPTRILSAAIQLDQGSYQATFHQAINPLFGSERRYIVHTETKRRKPFKILVDSPANLHSETNAADLIIITHSDFYTPVLPLAAQHQSQGLRTSIVDIQDIYDEFNGGLFDARAIQTFLSYAYVHWTPPAPAFVLLVGDGNFDFKNYLGRGEINYIPPFLADVDPWMGEVAADNRFVTVNGPDIFPDMMMGRLPVKTLQETADIVAKLIEYNQNPAADGFTQRMLFVADDTDEAGDFAAYSDDVVNNYVPSTYQVQKVYYSITHHTAAAARSAILQAINQGVILINYTGHGSLQFWADPILLHKNDLSSMNNHDYMPFVVSMTCLDGYFINPSPPEVDYSSLAESLVKAPGKGAIASWSPSGLGLSSGHDFLDRGLFDAIFNHQINQLGPAIIQAKLNLFANAAGNWDLIDTFTLFGDPAMHLNLVYKTYLPMVGRSGLQSPAFQGLIRK